MGAGRDVDYAVGDGDGAIDAWLAGKVDLRGQHGGTCSIRAAQLSGGSRVTGGTAGSRGRGLGTARP